MIQTPRGALECVIKEGIVGQPRAQKIAQALGQFAKVTFLQCQLSGTVFDSIIIKALKVNQTVKSLVFQRVELNDDNTKSIGQLMQENHSIYILRINECKLDSKKAGQIITALTTDWITSDLFSSTLSRRAFLIEFSDNPLKNEGVQAVAELLKEKTSCNIAVGLANCGATERAAASLAQSVVTNPSALVALDFGNNQIGNKGAKSMAQILSRGAKVANLTLNNCGIGDEGGKELALAIKNRALQSLDLEANHLQDESVEAICKAAVANPNLKSLHLADNPLSIEGIQKCRGILDARPDISYTIGGGAFYTVQNVSSTFETET